MAGDVVTRVGTDLSAAELGLVHVPDCGPQDLAWIRAAGSGRQGRMARRNLTVQLDDDVIRQAKVLAARRGTSVSNLVARELERLVAEDERYEEAWRRARRALGAVAARGGRRWTRDEIHER